MIDICQYDAIVWQDYVRLKKDGFSSEASYCMRVVSSGIGSPRGIPRTTISAIEGESLLLL
jgi:hypothetical protein